MDVVAPRKIDNIYITGTTRGLGKALKQRYESEYHFFNIIGLDRPQYVLGDSPIEDFVKTDFDIYIINAHHEWSQTELLYKLFEKNKNRRCQIIVIGSVSADGDRKEVNKYAIQKKALDAAVTQLQLVKSNCTITQFKLGRMNTDLVKHIDAKKMDTIDVARKIYEIVELNTEDNYFKTVTLDVKE